MRLAFSSRLCIWQNTEREKQIMAMRKVCGLVLMVLVATGAVGLAEEAELADAVEAQQDHLIRSLLAEGQDLNVTQVDGMAAIHWAAYHDDVETTRLLIDAGAQVDVVNRYGVTPLSLAAENGNGTLIEALLEAGADPNAILRGGETVLMTASRTGGLEGVKALLAKGAKPNVVEARNQTALMWAAAEGHADVVQELVAAGADVEAKLGSGYTPVFFAAREGHMAVIQVLLAAGVDINGGLERPKEGSATFVENPRDKPIDDGMSPLLLAVRNGHFEVALELVEAGADPNDMRTGFTPLHTVSWVRKPDASDTGDPAPVGSGNVTSLEFVSEMVSLGADVNAVLASETGRPPHTASRLAREGSTPFLMAADRADAALMQTFVDLGADPFLANAELSTPLMAAAGLGTTAPLEEAGTELDAQQAVTLLLDLGADIDAVDSNGDTPMHGATYAHFPSIVNLLSDHGADIEVWTRQNERGLSPLFIAEGHRGGGFKPSRPTIDAVMALMLGAGVSTDGPRPRIRDIYEKKPEPPAGGVR